MENEDIVNYIAGLNGLVDHVSEALESSDYASAALYADVLAEMSEAVTKYASIMASSEIKKELFAPMQQRAMEFFSDNDSPGGQYL